MRRRRDRVWEVRKERRALDGTEPCWEDDVDLDEADMETEL